MDVVLNEEEITLLLNGLIDTYGYDFTGYTQPMLQRRINHFFNRMQFGSFAAFLGLIKIDPHYFRLFIAEVMVPVTEMFRDPYFFAVLKNEILPALASFPLIRIWHAGCSTGEEVYSMAILLSELQLLQKSILYATDINPEVLKTASKGVFPLGAIRPYEKNYLEFGGRFSLNDYYTLHFDQLKFREDLKKRIVFSTHNLVADTSFNHFNLIVCRNVLIYFGQDLQNHALKLFDASLETNGFLALGSKETIRFSAINNRYKKVNTKEKIWQKL